MIAKGHAAGSQHADRSGAAPILVVDDDAKIVTLVRTYLEREGLSHRDRWLGALEAIREKRPSLVVLDVMLPELDGLALLRIVREDSDVPILILSARGSVLKCTFRELQNRWLASLAMSTDGSFPSRPRQF